jgi:hypothetical protein
MMWYGNYAVLQWITKSLAAPDMKQITKHSFSVVFWVVVGLSSVKSIERFSAASITAAQRWTNFRRSAVFFF